MTLRIALAFVVGVLVGLVAANDAEGRVHLAPVGSTTDTTVLASLEHVPTHPPGIKAPPPRRVVKVRAASEARPSGDVWWALAGCETGGTYDQRATSKTGRYLGYFQFDLGSWRSAGGGGDPRDHSYEQQLAVAQNWQRLVGWGAWPHCSRKLGLR